MLGINSNINSLVAQQNLNGSQSALSQAITRLSSGKRINSAADDAAGLAISTRMQTQINGLDKGVSNANDGVSMIQTASSALSSLTNSLQRIRTLAVQASTGTLSASDQNALQQEVSQQIAEVNRIASQTTYNGKNILDGSAGILSFQVGANVGQTVSLDLSQSMSAAQIGGGLVQKGQTVGTFTNLNLDSTGTYTSSSTEVAITSVSVIADGKGGFTFTDQNGTALSAGAVSNIFSAGTGAGSGTAVKDLTLTAQALGGMTGAQIAAANSMQSQINAVNNPPTVANLNLAALQGGGLPAKGQTLGALTVSLDDKGAYTTASTPAITTINVLADGQGGFTFTDQKGDALTDTVAKAIFGDTAGSGKPLTLTMLPAATKDMPADKLAALNSALAQVNANNQESGESAMAGANQALVSIDNALATVNNLQATLGAAQNRFAAIASTQQANSTNLSQAQSQIQSADFAQETANLSRAQVLQQAGISVLAQANSNPQQVLKLLQ
jgi:flagellin